MRLFEWLFDFPGHKINPVFLFYILPALLLLAGAVGLYFWLT
jgi:hypothetical protein